MRLRPLLPATALLLAACTDYQVGVRPKPVDEGVDTALDEDTAVVEEDTAEQVEEDTGAGGDTNPPDTADTVPPDTSTPDDTGEAVPEDPPPADDCDTTDDRIYVIDRDAAMLYVFDPATNGLTRVGELTCDSWSTPASMGVSRDGHAYVRYDDETVFDVDLATMRCSETTYSDRTTRFGAFGMGYATATAGTWRDQLYIANGSTLATLDTGTWRVSNLGRMPSQSELTGNAAGELWAVLPLESPAELRRLDPSTGAALDTIQLRSFPDPMEIDTFAFAAWGGELFVFVRVYGMGESTAVYRVDSASGRMERVVEGLGINVVGAGVSTCAPTAR
jgi:hypothetical protein